MIDSAEDESDRADVLSPERAELRAALLQALSDQGFQFAGERMLSFLELDKARLRALQASAVAHRIERARGGLARYEDRLLRRFARGDEISPEHIEPRLRLVGPRSEDELLFRYATLQWSVPVSSGYGRRLRFLIEDANTGKVMGLIGLGDPVINLGCRDAWIGWNKHARDERLQHVMDAYVLGSVPPYSHILGGKVIALLTAANEIRHAFTARYGRSVSLIRQRELGDNLALITTSSALGRSSVYNRLKMDGRQVFVPVGYSKGYGDFQFLNGTFAAVAQVAREYRAPSAKHARWGTGFRNRREAVKLALSALHLPDDLLLHGIGRQVFCVPLAQNAQAYLRGEDSVLESLDLPADQLGRWGRERWMVPRAVRDATYRKFDPQSLRRWGSSPPPIPADQPPPANDEPLLSRRTP